MGLSRPGTTDRWLILMRAMSNKPSAKHLVTAVRNGYEKILFNAIFCDFGKACDNRSRCGTPVARDISTLLGAAFTDLAPLLNPISL
jgi:hypothetical protein